MSKRFLYWLLAIIILVALSTIAFLERKYQSNSSASSQNKKIKVVTSLFPWYDIANHIGGNRVDVSLLLPPGVEPHGFEPTPQDIVNIKEAKLFVYTGDYLEPWAKDMLSSFGKSAPKSLAIGAGLAKVEKAGVDGSPGGLDPHIWLDPTNMEEAAQRFTKELILVDPAGKSYYENNLNTYEMMLAQLNTDFEQGLRNCYSRDIIYAGHYSFGYLARQYNLNYKAAQGFSPNAASSPQEIASLLSSLKKDGSHYLFAGELTNPQLAQSMAKEAKVEILFLNPAGNLSKSEFDAGTSYEQVMKQNLSNLEKGLQCKKY